MIASFASRASARTFAILKHAYAQRRLITQELSCGLGSRSGSAIRRIWRASSTDWWTQARSRTAKHGAFTLGSLSRKPSGFHEQKERTNAKDYSCIGSCRCDIGRQRHARNSGRAGA